MMRRSLLRLLGLAPLSIGGQNPPPQNAPGALVPAVGVQPGQSTPIVRARQVIVAGTTGEGVFCYSTNPPAFGTLIATAGVAIGGTDKYGNAYLAGTFSYLPSIPSRAAGVSQGTFASYISSAGPGGPWALAGQLYEQGGSELFIGTYTSIGGLLNMPQAALSDFPVSGSATLATTIAALNQLYNALVTAGVIA